MGQRNYKPKEDNGDVAEVEAREKKHYEKPLPSIPPEELDASSFQVGPPSAIDQCLDVPKTSAVSTLPATILRVSKRQHALNELLSSETVYASELVFIRDVCIPLALGKLLTSPHVLLNCSERCPYYIRHYPPSLIHHP